MAIQIRRIFASLVVVVLVLILVLVSIGAFTIRRSFPRMEGEVHLPGLNGEVDIYRDKFGLPHIYAAQKYDLFFAQGYVHAQDRFWQMDFWRHIGSGRLAEMFGSSEVETDQFLRTLGWARIAQQELQTMDPESLFILNAYADGVNAYLAEHGGSQLSLEYAVLKLINPSYKPEAWQPLHSMTWAKVMAWDLGGNMDEEIERAILMSKLDQEQLAAIFPPYPSQNPVIVPGFLTDAARPTRVLAERPAGLEAFTPALQSIKGRASRLSDLLGGRGSWLGSNNWVISGKLTATGKPFLANDPHLSAQMPSIWYEIGLHCFPKSENCQYEVTGFSFAGLPGVIIGHNDRIAWGMTNVDPDVQDLYIEKINPQNPNQYEYEGKWVDMQVIEETIQVAGGEARPLEVRITRHGPIVSDVYADLKGFDSKAGMELPASYAIAMRWTALDPTSTAQAILMLDRAQNWEEFRQAARSFDVPSQNLVYADVDGNIGYQMPGKIPVRAKGDGSLPAPGWSGEYEWEGFIPFEELPYSFNPDSGYIVTANNPVVGPEYPYLISTSWDYGYRARRIVDMIEGAPGPIDIPYIQSMQGDNMGLNAKEIVPILMQVPLDDARLEKARLVLQDWDSQNHMDSAAAALFEVFWKNLLEKTFHNKLPEDYYPGGDSSSFQTVHLLLAQPDSRWWDNPSTSEVEDRDQTLRQSFASAVDEIEQLLGKNPASWRWGELHTITFRNQTLGVSGIAPIEALFNRGPFQSSGGSSIVNATGWNAAISYQVRSLPSMRMIVDFSDLKNSLSIHTTGESGHAFHPNNVDMADLWRTIKYHPMLWEREQVEAAAKDHLRLAP